MRLKTLILLSVGLWVTLQQQVSGVVNGDPVAPEEFPTVGIVRAPFSNGTGTLIAPDIVLTAAHVVLGSDVRTPHHLSFQLDGKEIVGKGVALAIHADYRRKGGSANDSANDIALIKLDRNMPIEREDMYPLFSTPLAANQELCVVGYGLDETGTLAGARQRGMLRFLQDHQGLVITKIDPHVRQRTDQGDSGGPLLLQTARGWEIAAIVQGVGYRDAEILGVDAEFDAIEVDRFVSVMHHAKWLQKQLARLAALGVPQQPPKYLTMPSDLFDLEYDSAADLPNEPPLSVIHVSALLKSGASQPEIWDLMRTRGVSEPLTDSVLREWKDHGASDKFLMEVDNVSVQPFTFQQLLVLVKVRTPESQLRSLVLRRGLYRYLDREKVLELLDAGASREFIKELKRLMG